MPPRRVTPPEAPPTPIETRGERLGIKFNRGRSLSSNSHLALEGAEFAFEYGDAWRFHRRMFKAYFEDLEDIGRLEAVVRIGADTDEGIAWTRGVGVTAIPTFVFNQRLAVVGAQELATFRQVLDEIGSAAEPS